MKKKTKQAPVNKSPGTPVLGVVHTEYVQINVPDGMVTPTVEAMSQLILSDYHRKFLPVNNGDGTY